MKKILITGANGYIGRHVVKTFLNENYDVYVSDFGYKGMDERAKIVETSIFSGEKNIYKTLGEPDILIHLAWRNGFVHNSNAHMEDLSAHVTFLKNMLDGGLQNLSVMGSMHEIGYWNGEVDEKTPCNPMSMYGISKNSLRQWLLLYTKNKPISVHWLRAFYIYGDDARGSSIFAKLCQAVEDGKKIFPFTLGKNEYDFIHIEELARQIFAASIQAKITGIINVCTGKTISLSEKVENFIKENHWDIKLQYGAYPERDYDSPRIWGNSEKIDTIMKQYYSEREMKQRDCKSFL